MFQSRPIQSLAIALFIFLGAVLPCAQAADKVHIELAWAVVDGDQSGKYSGVLELDDGEFDGSLKQGVGYAQLSGTIANEEVEVYGQIKADTSWKPRRFKVTLPMRDGTASSKFQSGGGILRAGGAGGEFDIELTLKTE